MNATKSPASVLVIEDDAEINQLVGAYAGLCGLEYRAAPDGASAFRQIAQRVPHLIILDLMLPDMDGFEVCRRVKTAPDTHRVPVIILSALAGPQDLRRGWDSGADDYITKPFDPEALMSALRRHGGVNGEKHR